MAKAKATPPAATHDTPPGAGATPGMENASMSGAEAADTQAFNALRITSTREGFRRAGRAWSAAPTDVMLAEFDDAQLAMLRAEPMLMVEDITIEAAAE